MRDKALSGLISVEETDTGDLIYLVQGGNSRQGQLGHSFSTPFKATGAETRRALASRFADFLSVKDFGATGDGTTDDTDALNTAFAYGANNDRAIYIPPGRYKISDTLWATPEGSTFLSAHILGAGKGVGSSLEAQTLIDASSITAKPAINIPLVRGSYLGHFGIIGGNTEISSTIDIGDLAYDADYVADGFRDSRYSPHCGICIDGGVGPTPPDGGYSGFTYRSSSGGSADVVIDNVAIRRFVVGIMHNPENGAQQGDQVLIINPYITSCKVPIASGQSQANVVTVVGGALGWCRTCLELAEYGRQQGKAMHCVNMQFGPAFEMLSHSAGFGPLTLDGCYAESVHRIGQNGSGASTSAFPVVFNNTSVQLLNSSFGKRCPIVFESSSAALVWNGGHIAQAGTQADALFVIADPFVFDGTDIELSNVYRPFVGCLPDFSNVAILRNCRVRDSSTALKYGDERRLFRTQFTGRIPRHWNDPPLARGNRRFNYILGNENTYINAGATLSNVTFSDTELTFDHTDAAGIFVVGDILYWRFTTIGKSLSQRIGPALKVTGVAAPTVTCDLLYDRSYYDETYEPGSALRIMTHEWAPAQCLTGDLTSGSETVANVSPTGIIQVGDWVTADQGIPSNTRVTDIDGSSVTLSRNANASITGAHLYWGSLVDSDRSPLTRVVAVGNVGSGTDDLQSVSLPANSLWRTGKGVKIEAWGTTANNSNPKTVTLAFGSTSLISTALTVSQAGVWAISAEVISTGVDAQRYTACLNQGGTTTLVDVEQGTATEDDGAAITIKCTGTVTDGGGGINNDDIVQNGLVVTFMG